MKCWYCSNSSLLRQKFDKEGIERSKAMKGWSAICLYRALTWAASPLLVLHLHWRRLRGLEHALRWRERFGSASLERPPGPLLWFHAVSLGIFYYNNLRFISCCIIWQMF